MKLSDTPLLQTRNLVTKITLKSCVPPVAEQGVQLASQFLDQSRKTWVTILNLHLIWGVGRINCSNRWWSLISCLCDKVDNKLYRFGIHLLLIPITSKVTIWDEQVFISLGDLAPFTSLCYGRGNFSCSSRLGQSEGTLNVMNSFYSLKESNK